MSEQAEARWYVVHTYTGYENKVMTDLEKMVENRGMQDLIFEMKIPTETVVRPDTGKEYVEKTYPGYVFIKMIVTDDSWYVVRNINGVTGFVGPGSKPVPLTDAEVANIGVEKRSVVFKYSVGDTVEIVDGPLKGFSGTVTEIDNDENCVRVNISMFGRETTAELEFSQIKLAE